jgi:hypothetical protein
LILVNVSDTVQINASNQNGSDGDYDCVVVQFIAMAFGPDTAGSDMKHLKPSDMTSTSAPFADVTFNDPLNISVPVLDFSDPQPTTWQSANEGETTAGPYGAMKTRNAAISGKRIFRAPNVSFQTQNSGVLQFRVVVAISYQNNGPQYYSFDPYMKIS